MKRPDRAPRGCHVPDPRHRTPTSRTARRTARRTGIRTHAAAARPGLVTTGRWRSGSPIDEEEPIVFTSFAGVGHAA